MDDINKAELLREPIGNDGSFYVNESINNCWSPNKKHRVIVSHCFEPSMMANLCLFTLANGNAILNRFEPLTALPSSCKWSQNSRYFSIAARSEFYFYMIWDSKNDKFAIVRMNNPYPLELSFIDSFQIKIQVDDTELRMSNSTSVVGGDTAEWPTYRYKKPLPLKFNIDQLPFHDGFKLKNIPQIAKNYKEYSLELIKSGFHPFKGNMPISTVQHFNGRQMELFHLEAFALYGDDISKKWLKEIKQIIGSNYSPWDKVETHLGNRDRP
jgi:hypothetical protein